MHHPVVADSSRTRPRTRAGDPDASSRRRPPAHGRRHRTVVLDVLVPAVLVTVLAGCASQDEAGSDGAEPRVVVVGDSLTVLSDAAVRRQLDDEGVDLEVLATNGATAREMLAEARPVADDPAGQLIVNVGTNDVLQGIAPDRTLARVTDMLELFPNARCVHLVTINGRILSFDDAGLPERIASVNRRLRDLARERPRVRIIDWSAIVADSYEGDRSELIAGDTVHPTTQGQQRLAEAYTAAVDACAAQPPEGDDGLR